MTLAQRLSQKRKELGHTQADLAKLVGVSQQAIERIEAGATENPRKIVLLGKVLGVSADWLLTGEGTGTGTIAGSMEPNQASNAMQSIAENEDWQGATSSYSARVPIRDLPVLGRAQGGPDGSLVLEQEPIDWTFRPPSLDRVDTAFAVFVTGASMEPRYFAGDILYVHPARPVRPRRHVLVETENHEGFIKRFDGWKDDNLMLYQYNPDGPLTLPRKSVRRVLLVIGAMEDA